MQWLAGWRSISVEHVYFGHTVFLCRFQNSHNNVLGNQWRREGGHAPRTALCRGWHLEGRNVEFWNVVTFGKLAFALQTVIFYTLLTPPNTVTLDPLVLGPHSQLSVLHDPSQSMYTKKLTLLISLIIHLL